MAILGEYHRPSTIGEALGLLQRRDVRLLPLAGGTHLVGQLETRQVRDADGVVDLAGLGLSAIEMADDRLVIGATATLTDLCLHPLTRALAGGILPRTARREGPINLRNQATVGGTVASAEMDSELYAALLALDARVVGMDADGERSVPLADAGALRLITRIEVPRVDASSGHARVARTPEDRCIVAAVAVVGAGGERVALCGVAPRPILDGQVRQVPSNFKGSAEYRQAVAEVVLRRALEETRGG